MLRELSLQEIQQRLYVDMVKITDWMEEKHINYSLSGGTLLGAIRHNGFIPWDDDIDLCAPRPDYERMVRMIRDGKCRIEGLEVTLPGMKGHYSAAIRFQDASAVMQRRWLKGERLLPLWVSVFPMDHVSADPKKFCGDVERFFLIKHVLHTASIPPKKPGRHLRWSARRIFYFLLGGYRNVTRLIDLHARWVGWRNRKGNRWGNICWTCYQNDWFASDKGFRTQMHAFEDGNFSIMKEYDQYLTNVYGDYMIPLPEGSRKVHNLKVFAVE